MSSLIGSTVAASSLDEAFPALIRQHQAMVFSIGLHYLRNRSAAEEVAQEVFLQLYREHGRLQGDLHIAAWLRRVACHRAIDYARKRKFESPCPLEELPEPSGCAEPADPLLSARLRRMVDALPEKARMVMILRYQEDQDPEDIARTLAMPVRTVKSHLQRSLALLRQKLGRTIGVAAPAGRTLEAGEKD